MLPNCEGDEPDLLPVAEAQRRISGSLLPLEEVEIVGLEVALDRILAETVMAPMDVPAHRNAAMDGYAIRFDDLAPNGVTSLEVAGTAWAGTPYAGELRPGQAARIMTGARMPDEADTVVMQEQTDTDGNAVRMENDHKRGQNVREAGEDLLAGAVVLEPGQRLGPAELGLMGSLGKAHVTCYRPLRVGVFSTGDEVRRVEDTLDPGCIYDSNRYTLLGMLQRLGAEVIDLGVLPDDRDVVESAMATASKQVDALITSGGVSAGARDFVKEVLETIGQVGFWKIAIRPGRPLAFGRINNAAFFGLPGNPVAVMVTFYQFALPALRTLMGERTRHPTPAMRVRIASKLRKRPGRVEYYRAIVATNAIGELEVRSTGATGSGLLHTMSDANCFIILPHEGESVEAGDWVSVQPFTGLT
jgi:molybdopterin molybdotransferase